MAQFQFAEEIAKALNKDKPSDTAPQTEVKEEAPQASEVKQAEPEVKAETKPVDNALTGAMEQGAQEAEAQEAKPVDEDRLAKITQFVNKDKPAPEAERAPYEYAEAKLRLEQMQKELQAAQEQLNLERQQRTELASKIKQTSVEDKVNHILSAIKSNAVELDTLDTDQVNELSDRILAPMLKEVTSLFEDREQQSGKTIKELQEKLNNLDSVQDTVSKMQQANEQRARNGEVLAKLYARLPDVDFEREAYKPAVSQKMQERIPGTNQTYNEAFNRALQEGDVDILQNITEVVLDLGLRKNSPSNTADVSSSANLLGNRAPQQPKYSFGDLGEFRTQLLNGEITREQYQEKVNAVKQYKSA